MKALFVYLLISSSAQILHGNLRDKYPLYEGYRYVDEGSPFSITCYRTQFPPMKWRRNNKSLDVNNYNISETKLKSNVIKSTLFVDRAILNHTGDYKCSSVDIESHHLEVVPKEFQVITDEDIILNVGEKLEIYCEADPDSIIPVTWWKNGIRIEDTSRIKASGNKLVIEEAKENDAGQYSCLIKLLDDSKPADDSKKRINVYSKPTVEQLPSRLDVILGRTLEMECKTEGYPVPKLMWFINDTSVEDLQENNVNIYMGRNLENGLSNARFVIRELKHENRGEYKCQAKNAVSEVNTTTSLILWINALKTNEEKPGNGITLKFGSPLILQCTNTDELETEVKWRKDSKEINNTDSHRKIGSNNTLTIEKPTEEDAGNYTCFTKFMSATIVVRTKAKVEPFDKSYNLAEGDRMSLECKVSGQPAPSIVWYKDDEEITEDDKRIIISDSKKAKNAVLVIESLKFDDRAHYKCEATNEVSTDSSKILVRVKDKYAALWPFLGICAEVAVLCTIIFVYERKRSKADFAESDTDNSPDLKNTADHKGQELRQRK